MTLTHNFHLIFQTCAIVNLVHIHYLEMVSNRKQKLLRETRGGKKSKPLLCEVCQLGNRVWNAGQVISAKVQSKRKIRFPKSWISNTEICLL